MVSEFAFGVKPFFDLSLIVGEKGFFEFFDFLFYFHFGYALDRIEHVGGNEVFDGFDGGFVYWRDCGFDLLDLELGDVIELELADFFDFFVSESERFEDFFFWYFVHASFNHGNGVESTRDDEVHLAGVNFIVGWVDDELAVFETDSYGTNWTFHWRATHEEGDRGSDDCGGCWVGFAVSREDGGDYLDFVDCAFWEHWAKWAIDQARNECGFFGWAAFAFNEAAAFDFAVGEIVFFVVDDHWEEIGAFTSFIAHGSVGHDDGVAVRNDGVAGCVTDHWSVSDFELAAGEHMGNCFEFHSVWVK